MRACDERALTVRERVYATLTGLTTLLVLLHVGTEAPLRAAVGSVAITMFGLFAAGLLAEVSAHAAVHGSLPGGSSCAGCGGPRGRPWKPARHRSS